MKWINKNEAMPNPESPILIKDKQNDILIGRCTSKGERQLTAKDLKDENNVFWKYNLK